MADNKTFCCCCCGPFSPVTISVGRYSRSTTSHQHLADLLSKVTSSLTSHKYKSIPLCCLLLVFTVVLFCFCLPGSSPKTITKVSIVDTDYTSYAIMVYEKLKRTTMKLYSGYCLGGLTPTGLCYIQWLLFLLCTQRGALKGCPNPCC